MAFQLTLLAYTFGLDTNTRCSLYRLSLNLRAFFFRVRNNHMTTRTMMIKHIAERIVDFEVIKCEQIYDK